MKILSVAWTIYDSRVQQFCGDCTGAGLVIKNLCEYIGRKEDSYLFIGKYALPETRLDHFTIVQTDDGDISLSNESHLKYMLSMFKGTLKKLRPDFVNFHGIGEFMRMCIYICIEMEIPYVYTEHLFIQPQMAIPGYEKTIDWEIPLYQIPDIKIIAVSTGVKSRILNSFPSILPQQIEVILNGTNFSPSKKKNDIRTKYSLSGTKVLLCVGTLLDRKNQVEIVEAYDLLPNQIKDEVKVIFCGIDAMQGKLQKMITERGFEKNLVYVGPVSSERMKEFYSIADGLIMPSLAEGFSIAALEAMAYGLPIIMFNDLECAYDLSDSEIVCFAEKRDSIYLKNAICNWFSKKWDKKYIEEFSKRFTMEKMADEYLMYYRNNI